MPAVRSFANSPLKSTCVGAAVRSVIAADCFTTPAVVVVAAVGAAGTSDAVGTVTDSPD